MNSRTENNLVGWETVAFPASIDDLGISRPGKVFARDYNSAGKIPVVDQGRKLVSGWTDDEAFAIRDGLPFVVFGDHTRAFKFVDFPFAIGADGTQLLKPREDFNPRFFYYACLQLPLPNRGYNRHFNLLKEQTLAKPPRLEQEKIAAVLWKVDRSIGVQEKLIAITRELKQSALSELFAHGVRGERHRESETGRLPQNWETVQLGSLGRIGNGSTPLKSNAAYWADGTIPWLTSAKVYDVTITKADQFVTPTAVKECHLPRVKSGSVLLAITGQGKTLGHAAVTAIETCVNQHLAYLQFNGEEANPHFIRLFLESRYSQLRAIGQGGGSTKGALTCAFLKSYLVPFPERPEQDEIASALMTIEHKISVHERKRATLQELFKTLSHHLMTGQIRVNNLDIDVSEVV
jgi:type I restriction enzyme, S subunit